MGDITFYQMPSLILTPGVYVEQDNSKLGASALVGRPRVLFVGQMLASGLAVANVLARVDSPNMAKSLFGQGSMLADMIVAFKELAPEIETHGMGVADAGGGTAATGTYAFTGTATAAGTFKGLVEDVRVPVGVTVGMTAAQLATAFAAAVNALPDLAVTASATTGTVTLTARHKGLEGNGIQLSYNRDPGDTLPAGLGLTVTAMASGATNPTLTSAIAGIGEATFTHIVHCWSDATSIAAFEALAAGRSDPMQMNYAEVYAGKVDTYSNHLTALASRNSPWGVYLTLKASMPAPAWRVLSRMVARIAASAADDPALPWNGLTLALLPPLDGTWFIRQERELLLEAGGATVKLEGGQVVIERVVTTSKTNALGQADAGQRDLTTVLTVNYMAQSARSYLARLYPRCKIADDASIYPATARVTDCRQIKASLVTLAQSDWTDKGLIENLDAFKAALVVQRADGDTSTVQWKIRPDVVNGLHVLAGQVQPKL